MMAGAKHGLARIAALSAALLCVAPAASAITWPTHIVAAKVITLTKGQSVDVTVPLSPHVLYVEAKHEGRLQCQDIALTFENGKPDTLAIDFKTDNDMASTQYSQGDEKYHGYASARIRCRGIAPKSTFTLSTDLPILSPPHHR